VDRPARQSAATPHRGLLCLSLLFRRDRGYGDLRSHAQSGFHQRVRRGYFLRAQSACRGSGDYRGLPRILRVHYRPGCRFNRLRAAVNGREVGDNCNTNGSPVLGTIAANGSNTTINGNPYVLQGEWSNDDEDCILSFVNRYSGSTVENTFVTGTDDLRDNSDMTPCCRRKMALRKVQLARTLTNRAGTMLLLMCAYRPPLSRHRLQQELLTLTSHNGFLQNNDHWNIQSIDLNSAVPTAPRSASSCSSATPRHHYDVPHHVPHAELSPHATTLGAVSVPFSTTAIATCRVPQTPFSFRPNRNNEQGKAACPAASLAFATNVWPLPHRQQQRAVNSQSLMTATASQTQVSDAVIFPRTAIRPVFRSNLHGTAAMVRQRRRQRRTQGICIAFDDGYANPTNMSDAIYIPHPIPGPAKPACPTQRPLASAADGSDGALHSDICIMYIWKIGSRVAHICWSGALGLPIPPLPKGASL